MPIERKLAAIMFTDIAGYTALSAKDETKALKLLDTQKQILAPIIEEFNGTLHKEMGDGLLFTFPTVTEAVKCGIKIQEQTKATDDLNLRIGIHEGEITLKDGDVLGDDVNVASRIEPFSAIGGIAISGKIQQNISSILEFETKYIGKPKLKGVSQKVEVYCITSHGLPQTDISKVSAKLEEESKFPKFALIGGVCILIAVLFFVFTGEEEEKVPSIAIIPLENKGESKDEFYSYSISSDLISDVSSAGDIRVASLKDIEKLDYKSLTNDEIANKLFVRYISQGTLWKVDSIFQLSMELYDTKKNKIKWSNNWQQNWSELPIIKGGLSENILTNLQVTTKQDITRSESGNAEAYELYLKAKNIYEKRENTDDTEIAQGLLNKAIKLDDNLISAKVLLGKSYREMGDYDNAMEIFNSALIKAEEIGDKRGMGESLNNIGVIFYRKGDLEKALDYYDRSLAIKEKIGDKRGMGSTLHNIAIVCSGSEKRDYNKALDYHGRSLAIFEELGDKSGQIYTIISIGLMHNYKGDYDKALGILIPVLKQAEDLGDKMAMGYILNNIGLVHFNKGDYEKALDYYDSTLAIKEKIGDKRGIGTILNNIGVLHRSKGDYDHALDYYGRSLSIKEELGYKIEVENQLWNIALVHVDIGDYDKAIMYHLKALNRYEERNEKYNIKWTYQQLGWINYLLGNYDKSNEYYEKQLVLAKELKDNKNISNIFNNKGLISFNNQDFTQALENLEISVTMQMEIDSTITLETLSYLLLSKKILGREYNIKEIHTLIKEQEKIDDYINFALFKLLEDPSYIETAYNQVQEKADYLEPDVKAKFIELPIPKAIVEEWEKFK